MNSRESKSRRAATTDGRDVEMILRLSKQLACWLVLVLGLASCASPQIGMVIGVTDGDSIKVMSNNEVLNVRLYGIDAPELKQAFGKEASDKLSKFVKGKAVELSVVDVDGYGRKIAKVYIFNSEHYINEYMVSDGFAWHYKKYAPNDDGLADAEVYARKHEYGLWAQKAPVPPWEWRAKQKAPQDAPSAVYWLNSSSGVRHNSRCRHFRKTKGRECKRVEGKACGLCGG